MKTERRRNWILAAFSGLALVLAGAVCWDMGGKIPLSREKVLTIGFFSDSYWEVQNGYSYRILDDAIRVFEESHPDVKVRYTSGILKEDYSLWLAEQMLSGTAPDVFLVLGEDFNDYAAMGGLKNLTSRIEGDEGFHEEEFYSSALRAGQYHGVQYALPYECAPKLMFVNRTILDQEGIEIPGQQWTWEDFYQICSQVTKDTDQNGVLDQFGVIGYTWEEAFESNGVSVFNEDGTQCSLTGTGVEAAIRLIERLEQINGGMTASERDFDLGNVAFQPMSFSEFRAYKSYPLSVKKYSGFEWGCIPMPAGPQGDNISTLDTLLVAMNERSRYPREAWELMKVLTADQEIQSEIFDYSEGVSVLRTVTESEETLKRLMESSGNPESLNLRILSDAVENAVVGYRFRGLSEAKAQVSQAVDAIMGEDSTIPTGQIIWTRRINRFLNENQTEQ